MQRVMRVQAGAIRPPPSLRLLVTHTLTWSQCHVDPITACVYVGWCQSRQDVFAYRR
jgi:hypothetical protein